MKLDDVDAILERHSHVILVGFFWTNSDSDVYPHSNPKRFPLGPCDLLGTLAPSNGDNVHESQTTGCDSDSAWLTNRRQHDCRGHFPMFFWSQKLSPVWISKYSLKGKPNLMPHDLGSFSRNAVLERVERRLSFIFLEILPSHLFRLFISTIGFLVNTIDTECHIGESRSGSSWTKKRFTVIRLIKNQATKTERCQLFHAL